MDVFILGLIQASAAVFYFFKLMSEREHSDDLTGGQTTETKQLCRRTNKPFALLDPISIRIPQTAVGTSCREIEGQYFIFSLLCEM